ncbi:MAG: PD40 domain-containing protein [Saprospiraceae bacterium]|nr:PD40 domain-containing protein [Saprospiraceae bacterium]
MRFLNVFILVLLVGATHTLQAQTTSQTSFGKNRVQYHRQFDEWLVYETDHFITYWYGDARNIAQVALQTAEYDYPQIQQLLEHQLTEKVEMLVFSDVTDLKQSNIGEEEIFQIKAGETKVIGNKIFVAFDGDHNHLRAQIREGTAGVLLNSMLFGTNLQEIVQNAVLLNLPGWYTNGLTAFCSEEWSTEYDNQLRDLMLSGKYETFDHLARQHPRLAGHAFWYYISLHFGRGTVSNLLYLTRINRSIDAGFLYVLGGGYRRTTDALFEYYKNRYEEEVRDMQVVSKKGNISIKNKKNLPFSQLKISPDGKRIAWVSNDIGKWRVWVQDLKTGKRKSIMRGGVRNALQATDYNYPLLDWNPDNERLGVVYEKRDVVYLTLIDPESGKKTTDELSPEYQRVYSIDFYNPNDLLLSAAVRGISDLYIYRPISKQSDRITQDFWDDLDATVVEVDGRKGVLFASNRDADTLAPMRLDTILPINRFDIYYYDLETRGKELVRVTNTPLANERHPVGIDSLYFSYLSDQFGVNNRQGAFMETYTAYHQHVVYLNDGAEVKAFDMSKRGEWPLLKVLDILAPLDTVLKNIDSTQIDSIRSYPVYKKRPTSFNQTNYDRNILQQDVSPRSGKLVEAIERDGKIQFYQRRLDPDTSVSARITRYRELTWRALGLIPPPGLIQHDTLVRKPAPDFGHTLHNLIDSVSVKKDIILHGQVDDVKTKDTAVVIKPEWLFQVPPYLEEPAPVSEIAQTAPDVLNNQPPAAVDTVNPPAVVEIGAPTVVEQPSKREVKPTKPQVEVGKQEGVLRFNPGRIIPYRLKFRSDFFSTTLDNNLLFEGLESYAGTVSEFTTPPPGILVRANFKDLLEDYVIEAGFRLPTTFNGTEYYLWLTDKKHRIDKRYALYRKTTVNSSDRDFAGNPPQPIQVRTNTVLGQYELRYPFNPFFSVRAMGTLRQDRSIVLSANRPTLEAPDYKEQRASVRLTAVYDNIVDVDLNLKTGTRARVFVEAVKRFEFNTQPEWSLKLNSGFMTVVGIDARHYQRLDRRSILAVRFAAQTTFGSERILYYLGGVDNWLFPQFNDNIPVPQEGNFAYQTLAANMRGFKQNIRNGSSYGLINTELRVPIFKYFSNKPVLGNFWRNFQLVGFLDAGTAWQGTSPYSGDNPLNTVFLYGGPINNPNVIVKVNYFRDPLVVGYGFGARALIFGMYLRFDYGWGIETRVVQDPIFHFALGTDF